MVVKIQMSKSDTPLPAPEQRVIEAPLTPLPTSRQLTANNNPSLFRRMGLIAIKTWHECAKPKRVIPGLITMLAAPLIYFFVQIDKDLLGSLSIYSASTLMIFNLLPMLYWWMLGLVFTISVSGTSSGLIADEIDKGTMLILVSKPVGRVQIFLGKFLGVFTFGALLSLVGLLTCGWVAVLFSSGNLAHFFAMLPFLLFMFAYSLFVELIFLSISMSLSSILKTGRKAMMLSLVISIVTFIVFFMFRAVLSAVYVQYPLYWLDIGYHLGNILVYAIQLTNIIPSSTLWQQNFNIFSSVFSYSMFSFNQTGDTAQNIDLGGYPLAGYVSPAISLLIWSIIAILLTIFGLYKLKRKEITS